MLRMRWKGVRPLDPARFATVLFRISSPFPLLTILAMECRQALAPPGAGGSSAPRAGQELRETTESGEACTSAHRARRAAKPLRNTERV